MNTGTIDEYNLINYAGNYSNPLSFVTYFYTLDSDGNWIIITN